MSPKISQFIPKRLQIQSICQGKAQKEQSFQTAPFCKDLLSFFWPCLPHLMVLSLDYFLSCFLSFSLCSLGFLPLPCSSPCFLSFTQFGLQPSALAPFWCDGMDCVLVPSSVFIREGEEKEKKKASNP